MNETQAWIDTCLAWQIKKMVKCTYEVEGNWHVEIPVWKMWEAKIAILIQLDLVVSNNLFYQDLVA